MFKFKKVCALLCSGMCLLGTSASANKGQMNNVGMDDFMNKESEEVKKGLKGWLLGPETFLAGARWGNRTKRAKAEGKLSVLNDPEVIKMLKKLNLDFFEREAKSKKMSSNLLYVARWAALPSVGVLGVVCALCVALLTSKEAVNQILAKLKDFYGAKKCGNEVARIESVSAGNLIGKAVLAVEYSLDLMFGAHDNEDCEKLSSEIGKVVLFRLIAIGAINIAFGSGALSLASVFNYYSQKFQGKSDEFDRIGEKISSKEGGIVKAVISKNTKAVDERKGRTLNRNPKRGNNAIQNRKRIKMGAH